MKNKKLQTSGFYLPDRFSYSKKKNLFISKDKRFLLIPLKSGTGISGLKNTKQELLIPETWLQVKDGLWTDKNKNYAIVDTEKYTPALQIKNKEKIKPVKKSVGTKTAKKNTNIAKSKTTSVKKPTIKKTPVKQKNIPAKKMTKTTKKVTNTSKSKTQKKKP